MSIRPTITRYVPLILLLAVSTGASFAQKKEIIQLQRDMAILQEQVRQADRHVSQLGERMAVFENLLKQNLDTSNKLHQAVAVIERSISKQADAVVGPVTSISTQVDSLSGQFGALRDAVEEMNSRMGKVQQQVEDIKNTVSTLPPPSMEGMEGEGMSGTSAETLFNSALTDYHRGTYESAEPQFQDYLQLYASTVRAAEAQFYLGAIAYQLENFEDSVGHFGPRAGALSGWTHFGRCAVQEGHGAGQARQDRGSDQGVREPDRKVPEQQYRPSRRRSDRAVEGRRFGGQPVGESSKEPSWALARRLSPVHGAWFP